MPKVVIHARAVPVTRNPHYSLLHYECLNSKIAKPDYIWLILIRLAAFKPGPHRRREKRPSLAAKTKQISRFIFRLRQFILVIRAF
jgi:hypothetical protein